MRSIFITTEFHATHSWPECPIEEVKFLQHEHRHTFKVKVSLEVLGTDREVEFFVFKDLVDEIIEKEYGPGLKKLGRMSCEMICDMLLDKIQASGFSNRRVSVEVSEDGEVGAKVGYL
jgi:hypothetical protein